MKEGVHGFLRELDRRPRDSMPPPRARGSGEWVPLQGQLERPPIEEQGGRQTWVGPLSVWAATWRPGMWPFWRAAEQRRRRLFRQRVPLHGMFGIGYRSLPVDLAGEIAWLRGLRVNHVMLPLRQDDPEKVQARALEAIHELKRADWCVSVTLHPSRGVAADPAGWGAYCHGILSQTGWLIESAQVGGDLDIPAYRGWDAAAYRNCFAQVERLRREFPGVALLAPGVGSFTDPGMAQRVTHLLPVGERWDALNLRAPDWSALASVVQDRAFVLHLLLAGTVAGGTAGAGSGRLRVAFPPVPVGCEAAAQERVAGSMIRRALLAAAAGGTDRVLLGVDPEAPVAERAIFSRAVRELQDQMEGACFLGRAPIGRMDHDFLLPFARLGRASVLAVWTDGEPRVLEIPFAVGEACDFLHRTVPLLPHPRVRLTRALSYFLRAE